MILGATGHRLHLLPGYRGDGSSERLRKTLLVVAMDAIEEWHPDEVISGMATGWDLAVAMAAMLLNIPFRAYVPFLGQERLWGRVDQEAYRGLLDEAADLRVFSPIQDNAAYHVRDQAIVDDSDRLIALWGGDSRTGTGATLKYADGWLVPWTNYMSAYMSKMAPGH